MGTQDRTGDAVSPSWPLGLRGLAYGGDYNPEQWPTEVWAEDVVLMRRAGVTLVTVGVFAWSVLEPEPGRFEPDWLADVLDRLHAAGVRVDLATPTAAPPAWFARAHPEALPVTRDGQVLGIGARESFCPSSPAYRQAATGIARRLAERFAGHPALAMWHVNNEYGAHVGPCYCPVSEGAFRDWLRRRYGSLDALNDAWGTTFWSQRYGDWAEVTAPRRAPMPVNPAQQLDFMRFSDAEYRACFLAERDVLRALTPRVPITTNFMATACKHMDYWAWASEVDVVTNDHYLAAEAPDNHVDLALSADLTRGLAGGGRWLLLEHSTGAVNWQPRNVAKVPGQMRRNSLAHIARGSDGACFFQWRASRFGAEKFHSAMVPQGGADTAGFRAVEALGTEVAALAEVAGSTVLTDVAVLWDWPSWWALELEFRPSVDLGYRDRVDAFYRALWEAHRTVAFVAPGGDLTPHPVVVVPSLYLVDDAAAAGLRRYVEGGGRILVSFFSGIVDEHDRVPTGHYPGRLRDVLGLHVEEFHPLPAGAPVALDGKLTGLWEAPVHADTWSESVRPDGAEVLLTFADGPDAGGPALTRHRLGGGEAWYLATRLDATALGPLVEHVLAEAGAAAVPAPAGVELVRRRHPPRDGEGTEYVFAINHTDAPAEITLPGPGRDLLTGAEVSAVHTVAAGDAAVVRLS